MMMALSHSMIRPIIPSPSGPAASCSKGLVVRRGGGGGGRLVELGVLVFAAALPQRGLGQSGR